MENNNRITSILGIKYPIVQAAMSWITDAKMVAAVSNAGGMGVLGPHGGYNVAPSGGPTEVGERLRNEIRKIKELTDKPFAVNLYMPKEDSNIYSKTTFEVALEEDVKYFVAVGEVNKTMIEEIKNHNGILLFRELTPTVEGAKMAEGYGADIIIATGYDEGGWIPQNRIGTFSIVPTIVDAVNIPVLATGGINDIRGVRAAFALGAEGVYVGTRFIVSEECPAADATKQDIIHSKAADLLLVSSLQRSTPHKLARELEAMYRNGEPSHKIEKKIGEQGGLLPGMLLGKLDEGIISVNTAIDLITEVKSCKEIIHELMADFIK
ncbi:NAD(P)H-dependent flavin oxidoreductase [Paenibacillus durus]|uniref:Probable nitronate monooxygenase n=1 Tax=Paenibacillus durus ATCC 35681 TaxID=1333534 RepID=A0A0F7FC93_PAEDU|nr:nitronate monooxygenase [Paenibacillus durus]AKG36455.1 2-nitropropane dioxygenase [Paenibacillus durus ATCC 35681]